MAASLSRRVPAAFGAQLELSASARIRPKSLKSAKSLFAKLFVVVWITQGTLTANEGPAGAGVPSGSSPGGSSRQGAGGGGGTRLLGSRGRGRRGDGEAGDSPGEPVRGREWPVQVQDVHRRAGMT